MTQAPNYLREEDARYLIRLLGELPEVKGDVNAQKRHLLSGLAHLVQADKWAWEVGRFNDDGKTHTVIGAVHEGLSKEDVSWIIKAFNDPDCHLPVRDGMFPLLAQQKGQITRSLTDFTTIEKYVAGPFYQRYGKHAGYGDHVVSARQFPSGHYSAVGWIRAIEKPAFTDRDKFILHLVCEEVPWLFQADLPVDTTMMATKLPPKQRHVLILMLLGHSAKESAASIGISHHTVNEHIGAIYERFNVQNRAELMALFVGGGKRE